MRVIKQFLSIFQIRQEERTAAIRVMLFFIVLNALNVAKFFGELGKIQHRDWGQFIKHWHLAGFDPITYSVLTNWGCKYNVYRHPLLAYFMWPFSKLNEWLIALTGMNCAMIITAILLVFFATYSFIFLSRIFHEIIGTTLKESFVLSMLSFSFAYVTLSFIAPDHFGLSMFCLILTLYSLSPALPYREGESTRVRFSVLKTIVLFVVTAGISLNNGLKVFLAALFARRKKFFKPTYLIFAVILPAALMWGGARLSYKHFVWPKEVARKTKAMDARRHQLENRQNMAISGIDIKDTARIAFVKDSVKKSVEAQREARKANSVISKHSGKPLMDGEFMRWTDITTNRCDVAVENLFGEGIMIHQDYLLGDVLINRPVIVHYRNWFNYIVEGILVLLFIGGIWYGRRSLFMWTAMSFFLMDMALHMGLGFGINEISIMSAHYLYVLPICMAYLLIRLDEKWRKRMTLGLGVIAAYLIVWNVTLLVEYLYM